MKKFLPLIAVLFSTFLLTSCESFGKDNGDGDEEQPYTPSLSISDTILAGSEVPVTVLTGGKDYELFFGETLMSVEESKVIVPSTMKGEYEIRLRVENIDFQVAHTSVFTFVGETMPGVAFRADLSGGNSLYTVAVETSGGNGRPRITTYETKKFGGGAEPTSVKFFNSKKREVPGAFVAMKNISEQFFFALLWNPTDRLFYDTTDFTCRLDDASEKYPVIIDKKTGVIVRLSNPNGDSFILSDPSFQWMGDRAFCFLPESYGGEFSTQKLCRFEIPELPSNEEIDNIPTDDFFFSVTSERVPGQENVDIINSFDDHWIASSWGTVLFNRERMLRGGSLSSVSFQENNFFQKPPVFCNYAEGGLYYLYRHSSYGIPTSTSIHALVGSLYHRQENCNCSFDIFQYPDHTYLRAKATKIGEVIHNITLTKDQIIVEEETVSVVEYQDAYREDIQYPCYSNYDYFMTNGDCELFRRTIAARNDDRLLHTRNIATESFGPLSQSANGCTFSVWVHDGASESLVIYDTDANGAIAQQVRLDDIEYMGMFQGLCRIRD